MDDSRTISAAGRIASRATTFFPTGPRQLRVHLDGKDRLHTRPQATPFVASCPASLGATSYIGRGITTGTVVSKSLARYLTQGDDALLPLSTLSSKPIQARPLWSSTYEGGFALYQTFQCLRVLV